MQFSVLMSIYNATRADDLDRCLTSIAEQSIAPNQIVLVRDGPIHRSVEQCIEIHQNNLPIQQLNFAQNRGLGLALRDGLLACTHELVARVDSDDWSISKRFELQINYLSNNPSVSVVGGWLKEHYQATGAPIDVIRQTPLGHDSIVRFARRRNPLNHPTVMFRKSHVLASGNYETCLLFEDYLLWAQMLVLGYCLANLPTVLVETNVDLSYFSRRGGLSYTKKELYLLRKLKTIGFLSHVDAAIFILSRLPVRLLPLRLRHFLYKIFLRNF